MSKKSLIAVMVPVAMAVLCLSGFASKDPVWEHKLQEYVSAVSQYYEMPLEETIEALEAGLTHEELPVALYIAKCTDVSSTSIADARRRGESWADLAEGYDLTAGDFYVRVTGERHGTRFSKIFAKFSGLTKDKFDQVSLADGDMIALANLRFLYQHYNYSQHLIMTWCGEGKSFVDINHQVHTATSEMRAKQLAEKSE